MKKKEKKKSDGGPSLGSFFRRGVASVGEGIKSLGREQNDPVGKRGSGITDPVTMVENSWNDFVSKVWIMIGYVLFTVIMLQFSGSSPLMKIFSFLLVIGIPVVAIGLLLSLIPTLRIGKYTIFSRERFSLDRQIKGSYKVSRFFFRRLYEVAPELIYILGGVLFVLVLSVVMSLGK